jgi:hypothetical protein
MNETQKTEEWMVTEYPDECCFAVARGSEIIAQVYGGATIGQQADLAARIAKVPTLERDLAEALEQRDALVEAVEMWRVRGNFVPPYVIAALAAVKDLAK